MKRPAVFARVVGTVALACGATALGARARAADPLDEFPADAAAVVRLASLEQFQGHLTEMLTAVHPVAVFARGRVDEFVNKYVLQLSGSPAALDRDAAIYTAFFLDAENGLSAACLVKADDETQLRKLLMGVKNAGVIEVLPKGDFVQLSTEDRTCYLAERGGYWLYTFEEDVAKRLVFDDEQATFASVLDEQARSLFDAGDASLAVNAAAVRSAYEADIKRARQQIDQGLQLMTSATVNSPSVVKAYRQFYGGLASLAFDALSDARWAVANVRFSKAGAAATALVGVAPDSKTDQWLAAHPPQPLANVELLPAGAPAYAAAALSFGDWSENWLRINSGERTANPEADEKAFEQMRAAELRSLAGSFSFAQGYRITSIDDVQNAETWQQGWRTLYGDLRQVQTSTIIQKFKYQAEAEELGDFRCDLLTTVFEFDEDVSPEITKVFEQMFTRTYGGTKVATRFARLDDRLVRVYGGDARHAETALEAIASGEDVVGVARPFEQTRKQLAGEANLVVLFDAPKTALEFAAMAGDFAEGQVIFGGWKIDRKVKPADSFAGLSAAAEDHAVRVRLFVPVEQPRGLMQLFLGAQ